MTAGARAPTYLAGLLAQLAEPSGNQLVCSPLSRVLRIVCTLLSFLLAEKEVGLHVATRRGFGFLRTELCHRKNPEAGHDIRTETRTYTQPFTATYLHSVYENRSLRT